MLCKLYAARFISFILVIASEYRTSFTAASSSGKFAFVSILQNEHILNLQVLRSSLKSSDHNFDTIVIVPESTSKWNIDRMSAAGWKIEYALEESNLPRYITLSLHAWLLLEYDKIILLDPDTVVLENINELFGCKAPLCFVQSQPELIGSTAIVLEPSTSEHAAMFEVAISLQSSSLYSFPHFLSLFMAHMISSCSYFEPLEADTSSSNNQCSTLPTRYNGDLLLAILNGGLSMVRTQNPMPSAWFDSRRAKILRFNLVDLKPSNWLFSPFLPISQKWQKFRLESTTSIQIQHDQFNVFRRSLLPVILSIAVATALLYIPERLHCKFSISTLCFPWNTKKIDPYDFRFFFQNLFFGVLSFGFASFIAIHVASDTETIEYAWTLFLVWFCAIVFIAWSLYLHTMKNAGIHATVQTNAALVKQNSVSPIRESLACFALLALLLFVLPRSAGTLSGKYGHLLYAALILLCIVLHVCMTMLRLPVLWYLHGLNPGCLKKEKPKNSLIFDTNL